MSDDGWTSECNINTDPRIVIAHLVLCGDCLIEPVHDDRGDGFFTLINIRESE